MASSRVRTSIRSVPVGVVALLAVAAPAAHAALLGTLLLDETFAGTSVADSRAMGLGDACLTSATAAPTAGESDLGPCVSTVGAPGATSDPGYLQLTDVRGNRVGGMLFDRALPSSAGLVIQFDQYQYGGSGADGIGFFLTDGSYSLTTAGGDGGSLGYAQKGGMPGVDGGYLGVGLDAFGNFVADTETRGSGCAVPSPYSATPNTVTLRGPGDGTVGYCMLASTVDASGASTLPATLRSATGPDGALRNVRITVSPDAMPLVTVEIDFTGTGTDFQAVLSYQMTDAAPSTYKFGFSSSTGGSTDVHLIRNVRFTTVDALGSLSLVAQVDNSVSHATTYTVGDVVPVQLVVTNTGLEPVTGVTVTSPTVAHLVCPSDSLGAAGTADSSMVCTGTHAVTVGDVTQATLTLDATAAAVDSTSATVSAADSVQVDLVLAEPGLSVGTAPTLEDADGDGDADPGERVDYAYTVTNTGNVPLTDVAIVGSVAGATTCESTTLAPGASTTCTAAAPYVVTPADVVAGRIVDPATASGEPPAGVATPSPAAAVALVPVSVAAPVPAEAAADASDTAPSVTASPSAETASPSAETGAAAPTVAADQVTKVESDPATRATGGALASTGAQTAPLAWVSLALAAAGAGSLMLGRRVMRR
ncbi:DUF7507 domain-containing protein [Demequina capsici]|uniref:DUF7507 domain-containing protein n=1 Tax=Demequina capsici TaxID=3075620 RepID=A0AA96J7K2_9MICO|nr:hypothetical protein [Demequina sp. OYTSA14]WNM25272.1 hypothetical protein RN606_03750 [Demequina sp. OYTSA14]